MENFSKILLFFVIACVSVNVECLPIDDTNNLRFSRANSHHHNLNVNYTQDLDDTISKQQQSSNAIGRNLDLQKQSAAEPENAAPVSNVGFTSIVRVAAQVGIQSALPLAVQPLAVEPAPQAPVASQPIAQPSQDAIRADGQINKDAVQERNQIANQRPAEIPAAVQESSQPRIESPAQQSQEPIKAEAQSQKSEPSPALVEQPVPAAPSAQIRVEPQIIQIEEKAPLRAEEQIQVRGQEPVRVEQPIQAKQPVLVDGQSEVKAPEQVRVEGQQSQVASQVAIGGQSEVKAPEPVRIDAPIVQDIVAPVVRVDIPAQVDAQPSPVRVEVPIQQSDSQAPVVREVIVPEPVVVIEPIVGEPAVAPVVSVVDSEPAKVEDSIAGRVDGQIVLDGQRSD